MMKDMGEKMISDKEKGILLGRTECRGAELSRNEEEGTAVGGIEVKHINTPELEKLVGLVKDEEAEKKVIMMFDEELMDETMDILGGLNVLIKKNNSNNVPAGRLGAAVSCFLNSDNRLSVETEVFLDEVYERILEEEAEKLSIQVEGFLDIYRGYYSRYFRNNWEGLIEFIFTDPENFKGFLQTIL